MPLSLAQTLPLAGSVIVCTPQKVAQLDARRAVGMFRQLEVPVLGVVENMSVFIDDVGGEHDLFGRGGAKALAEELALPVLGELPMHTCVRAGGDAGDLDLMIDGHRAITDAVGQLAGALAQQVAIATASGMVQPTISVKG